MTLAVCSLILGSGIRQRDSGWQRGSASATELGFGSTLSKRDIPFRNMQFATRRDRGKGARAPGGAVPGRAQPSPITSGAYAAAGVASSQGSNTIVGVPSASPVPFDEPLRRLSVAEYEAMVESGVFNGDDRLELLEGYLVEKTTKSPAHSAATRLLRLALTELAPPGWFVETQEPIATPDSEPEPDIAIVHGSPRDYSSRHPAASDVALVVEVADTSLRRDRTTKGRVYATAGIPRYWIVNLAARSVEVFEQPGEGGYDLVATLTEQDELTLVLDGRVVGTVRVADVLPP